LRYVGTEASRFHLIRLGFEECSAFSYVVACGKTSIC
jgi:hypothetical protein